MYGVYTLVVLYQKSHSFASLTCSISDTPQLVCKHRTRELSMKCSIRILHLLRVYYEFTTWPAPSWLDSSVDKALHRYRRVHGLESRSGLNFFFTTAEVVRITAMINHIYMTSVLLSLDASCIVHECLSHGSICSFGCLSVLLQLNSNSLPKTFH